MAENLPNDDESANEAEETPENESASSTDGEILPVATSSDQESLPPDSNGNADSSTTNPNSDEPKEIDGGTVNESTTSGIETADFSLGASLNGEEAIPSENIQGDGADSLLNKNSEPVEITGSSASGEEPAATVVGGSGNEDGL